MRQVGFTVNTFHMLSDGDDRVTFSIDGDDFVVSMRTFFGAKTIRVNDANRERLREWLNYIAGVDEYV